MDGLDRTYDIAVVGDSGSIAGFGGLGLRTFPVTLDTDPRRLIQSLIDEGQCAIIYITEPVAERLDTFLAERADDFVPAIITIPSAASTEAGSSLRQLQRTVMAAVGFDVIENLPEDEEEGLPEESDEITTD